MPHTLVSFLGSARLDPESGYRKARYVFGQGEIDETPFFGLALARKLKPDRLLILGTSGSMWPVLLESGQGSGWEAQRLALIEAEGRVTQEQLDALEPFAREALGCNVSLRLIPYARNEADQEAILALIAREAGTGRVSFDVTHGFRHLAMLGMLSAFMLRHGHGLKVEGLWYGALDMTSTNPEGLAPAVRLDGLLAIEEWLTAFVHFEASGDFSRFAPLLEADGLDREEARRLPRAWNHLNATNVADAVRELRPLHAALERPLTGSSELFRERLRSRLEWCRLNTLWEQQRALARAALERGDFMRAAIFGMEAVISRECLETNQDPLSYDARKSAKTQLLDEAHAHRNSEQSKALLLLNTVRNTAAHGTPPKQKRDADLMRNPERLREAVATALKTLLG